MGFIHHMQLGNAADAEDEDAVATMPLPLALVPPEWGSTRLRFASDCDWNCNSAISFRLGSCNRRSCGNSGPVPTTDPWQGPGAVADSKRFANVSGRCSKSLGAPNSPTSNWHCFSQGSKLFTSCLVTDPPYTTKLGHAIPHQWQRTDGDQSSSTTKSSAATCLTTETLHL